MKRLTLLMIYIFLGFQALPARELYIMATGTNGDGSAARPYTDWKAAMLAMSAGDTLLVMSGTYNLVAMIDSRKNGEASAPMVIRAYNSAQPPLLTRQGPVFRISHPYHVFEGFIIDGQFGTNPLVNLKGNAHGAIVRNCVIRNEQGEGIEIREINDVLIEKCEIYHCLRGTADDQTDAHGIAAYRARNLTVRGCNIHQVSGDCFQIDPIYQEMGAQMWDNVLIENCHLWTGPMATTAPGYPAGSVPGENAVDTKTYPESIRPSGYRPSITIRGCDIHGFEEHSSFNNRAALNLKHNVNALVENTRIYNSYIAFRVRGGYEWDGNIWGSAHVTARNCIVYDNEVAVWFERGIEYAHFYHCTFDKAAGAEYFDESDGGYQSAGFEMFNCLFFDSKPGEASHTSNLQAGNSDVLSRSLHNYYPSDSSRVIDAGIVLAGISVDFSGQPRVMGDGADVGALEYFGPVVVPVSGLNVRQSADSRTITITLLSENAHEIRTMRLFNNIGQVVNTQQIETGVDYTLEVPLLSPGIYVIDAGKGDTRKILLF